MVGIASRSSLPGCKLPVHGVTELQVQWKKGRGGPVLAWGLVGALDSVAKEEERERAAVTSHNNSCSTNMFNLTNHFGSRSRYITTVSLHHQKNSPRTVLHHQPATAFADAPWRCPRDGGLGGRSSPQNWVSLPASAHPYRGQIPRKRQFQYELSSN